MNAIYSITNIVDGRTYIGQTVQQPNRRWRCHRSELSSNKHRNPYLQHAWNKYGADKFKFELVVSNIPETCLDIAERAWILHCKQTCGCYNLTDGGNLNKHLSVETRDKISQKALGRKQNTEQRACLSTRMRGNQYRRGKPITPENLKKMCEAGHTVEAQRLRSASMTGHKHSKQTKLKMSEVRRAWWCDHRGIKQENVL